MFTLKDLPVKDTNAGMAPSWIANCSAMVMAGATALLLSTSPKQGSAEYLAFGQEFALKGVVALRSSAPSREKMSQKQRLQPGDIRSQLFCTHAEKS